jgi:hypothetical protein
VIELLDLILGIAEEGKYQTGDTIHKIFFPIKKEFDEINYEQQNLWLIDERLSYHSYLSSDKMKSLLVQCAEEVVTLLRLKNH